MKNVLSTLSKILLWILSICVLLSAIPFFPSVTSILFLLFFAIALPVENAQNFWRKIKISGISKAVLLVVLLVIGMASAPINKPTHNDPLANTNQSVVSSDDSNSSNAQSSTSTSSDTSSLDNQKPLQQTSDTEQSTKPENTVPTEYKNALENAKQYSELLHMSKQGIYDQLVSEYGEHFPPEAAQYAVDNLQADYKANALAKAKSYSDNLYMSKLGIYDQLISEYGEKFTPEEAQYAVDNLQADYKANALVKAKSYYENMNMSKEGVREQLISEYGEQFTAEEADYAIANLE
ncbi:MAG: Ltp family lipoprotein [Eubacteriales bacterium]